MYESNFRPILARAELANAYLIYGGCDLSLEVLAAKICKVYGAQKCLKMSDLDFDFAAARDFLQINDLFAQSKILIIESYKDELKGFKLEQLRAVAAKDSYLLIIAHTAKAQKAAEKAFANDFVRVFAKEQEYEQIALLQEFAAVLNVKAARSDLAVLVQNYSHDLNEAAAQIRKFKGANLDLSMCDFVEKASEEFDEFFGELFKKAPNFKQFSELFEGDEIAMSNKIAAGFLRLFKLNAYAKEHASLDFSVALGYTPPPKVRTKLQQFASICDEKFHWLFKEIIYFQNNVMSEAQDVESEFLRRISRINRILTKKP